MKQGCIIDLCFATPIPSACFASRDLLVSDQLLIGLMGNPSAVSVPGEPVLTETADLTPWGRAYRWAQEFAGSQCLPDLEGAPSDSSCLLAAKRRCEERAPRFGFIDSWFPAVSKRLEARMALNAEVNQFIVVFF